MEYSYYIITGNIRAIFNRSRQNSDSEPASDVPANATQDDLHMPTQRPRFEVTTDLHSALRSQDLQVLTQGQFIWFAVLSFSK